ncbi:MAG: dTDP-glucose 4,6-dehydratase [Candidatus Aenigmarchaeota archaeon]|nr:dTDP-glucose 4,6-dehydratase [Candidatus Aenigmarchaeota archaeon]
MKLLVTGGAGFIGSNFVNLFAEKYDITVLDKLTYCGCMENLRDVMNKITFVKADVCDAAAVEKAIKDCDAVVHYAAQSHVDRSITDSDVFIKTNVLGTHTMLEAARKHDVRFVHISTDEIYGQIESGSWTEQSPLCPRNPYSASKAAADMLAQAYFTTYGLPVVITRSSNNFGPRQFPEKIIPLFITNALNNRSLPVYGDGMNVRDWLYVIDNCEAIEMVMHKGKPGEAYNIGGGNEMPNIEITKLILSRLNKPESLITFVKDRPGHDKRYSLDFSKIKKLGWQPRFSFEDAMKQTVDWYVDNRWWWEPLVK